MKNLIFILLLTLIIHRAGAQTDPSDKIAAIYCECSEGKDLDPGIKLLKKYGKDMPIKEFDVLSVMYYDIQECARRKMEKLGPEIEPSNEKKISRRLKATCPKTREFMEGLRPIARARD
ncbi:hypothetical protein [Fluviicola sp.]|uniref:hypothetical protein n=1 Tax=Fluviicola sp. TaxID=1917219 RepID=UPI0031E1F484